MKCQTLNEIQQEALCYLRKFYDFSDQKSLKTDLWLKIDTVAFLNENPALIRWFRSLGLKIREIALTVVNDHRGAKLHIDELPVVAKINIPLMNYHDVVNEWWEIPTTVMESQQPSINQFGYSYYLLDKIDLSLCQKIGSVEMSGPIVFNSQIAHRVVTTQQACFPRVVLTCMFFNEPLDYLK